VKKVALYLAMFLVVSGLGRSFAEQNVKPDWTIFLRHAGPIRFGMSLSDVRKIIGDPNASLFVSDPDNPLGDKGCTYPESLRLPEKLGFMFDNHRVVRVDVFGRSVAQTARGARVGDTEERIRALYPGQIRVEPHPYNLEHGHYLIFVPKDPSDRMYEVVFETDGEHVTSFRAGFSSATALIEGCS
jgi:hypothetical protein